MYRLGGGQTSRRTFIYCLNQLLEQWLQLNFYSFSAFLTGQLELLILVCSNLWSIIRGAAELPNDGTKPLMSTLNKSLDLVFVWWCSDTFFFMYPTLAFPLWSVFSSLEIVNSNKADFLKIRILILIIGSRFLCNMFMQKLLFRI